MTSRIWDYPDVHRTKVITEPLLCTCFLYTFSEKKIKKIWKFECFFSFEEKKLFFWTDRVLDKSTPHAK
jgi:hypothetical protein